MHTTENIHLPVSNIRTQYRSNHRFIRDFVSSPKVSLGDGTIQSDVDSKLN